MVASSTTPASITPASITTVLLDLDGVIRHFDPGHRESVEQAHGLAPGRLADVAFAADLIDLVVTGRMSRAEWTARVGERISNSDAAHEWLAAAGAVDEEMLGIVDELRQRGTVVAVLTNGTDTIPDEMEQLELAHRFDAIFNTADIGWAKPDRRAFEHVCHHLAVPPSSVFFTDDSEHKLGGAVEIGMTARRFDGVAQFRDHLDELGLGPSEAPLR